MEPERRVDEAVGPPREPVAEAPVEPVAPDARDTAASPGYGAVAVAAIGISLLFLARRSKWGGVVARWLPAWLTLRRYDRVARLEARERRARGASFFARRRAVGISNRPLEDERREQALLPPRGRPGAPE